MPAGSLLGRIAEKRNVAVDGAALGLAVLGVRVVLLLLFVGRMPYNCLSPGRIAERLEWLAVGDHRTMFIRSLSQLNEH